jgi:hypothetical protein
MFPFSSHVVALPGCQLGRSGRLALHKGEGRVREDFKPIEAIALNPQLSPLSLGKGRGN